MEDSDKLFQICPKCHIGYQINNTHLFDHIVKCDGRPDIITTRFYKKEVFYKNKNSPKNIIIKPSIIQRPVTR